MIWVRCNYACPLTAGPESVHIPKMVLIMFLKNILSSVVHGDLLCWYTIDFYLRRIGKKMIADFLFTSHSISLASYTGLPHTKVFRRLRLSSKRTRSARFPTLTPPIPFKFAILKLGKNRKLTFILKFKRYLSFLTCPKMSIFSSVNSGSYAI